MHALQLRRLPLVLRGRLTRHVDLEGQIGDSYRLTGGDWRLFRVLGRYGSGGVRVHLGRP